MATKKRAATPKKQPKKSAPMAEKDICFVIMPFGGWQDDYYKKIYCTAIESAGLSPHRADDLFRPSTIVNDIWEYTKKAKIILAVLTDKNPNVLYELGLAHAIAKPAILVTETLDDIPFDLRALRVIEYDKNAPDWGDSLKYNIENAIKEVIKSPLKSVLPTFLEVDETQKAAPISAHEKEILEIRSDIDLLRREVRSRPERVRSVPRISADEAENIIQNLIDQGATHELILEVITDKGAPDSWVRKKIDELVNLKKKIK